MIIPDLNLVVYAYNQDAPMHSQARAWWQTCLSESGLVGIPWVVILGFIRLMTNRRVLLEPMSGQEAVAAIRSWLERPQARLLDPGVAHLDILERLLGSGNITGNLTTDAHLAAIAIEHQAEIHSNDSDFARFAGLRWRNPLKS